MGSAPAAYEAGIAGRGRWTRADGTDVSAEEIATAAIIAALQLMMLPSGTRLRPYEILAPLGAGVTRVAEVLRGRWNVQSIAPGHCTGEIAFARMRAVFGDRYVYAGAGTTMELGPG